MNNRIRIQKLNILTSLCLIITCISAQDSTNQLPQSETSVPSIKHICIHDKIQKNTPLHVSPQVYKNHPYTGKESNSSAILPVETPLDSAKKALDAYLEIASPEESSAFQEYLSFYRSWYQAVTPAPYALHEKVMAHKPSAELIKTIKKIVVDNNLQKEPSGMAGASRLLAEGEAFFFELNNYLRDKRWAKTEMSTPQNPSDTQTFYL